MMLYHLATNGTAEFKQKPAILRSWGTYRTQSLKKPSLQNGTERLLLVKDAYKMTTQKHAS
jgi:hypothetical protein